MTFAAVRAVIAVVVSSGLGLLMTVLYVNHVEEQGERRQCAVLAAELAVYRESPPTTETGRRLAGAKSDQFRRLGC